MNTSRANLIDQFTQLFGKGGDIRIVRAPGRVNLIGEHTDYNDGYVFPMAIESEVRLIYRKRRDNIVRIASTLYPNQIVEFSVADPIKRGVEAWANYVRGVAAGLVESGLHLCGMEALYTNTLPPGGGLSSSAAMQVSTALCFLSLMNQSMDRMKLARLCQRAENNFVGLPCGIMDQMIVATAKAGHATLFDCRTLHSTYVPVQPENVRVVICNSMVKHELTGSEYADRKKECETGVAFLKKKWANIMALRDATMDQLNAAKSEIPALYFKRCRHVISENGRCLEAADCLQKQDYRRFGELMVQSHHSLRDDYQVSCDELDFLVNTAMQIPGVYGARMTGGGFGGCIVALCKVDAAEQLESHLRTAYSKAYKIEPTIFSTIASEAASEVIDED